MGTPSRPLLLSSLFVVTLLGNALSQNPEGKAQESRPASAPATAVLPKNPEKAKAALTRAQEKNKKRDMSADMDIHISIMGMEITGTGNQKATKDGKMRMDMTMEMPMGQGTMKQLVINDGKNVWTIMDMPGMGAQIVKATVEESKEAAKKQGGGMMGGSSNGDAESTIADLQKQFEFDTVEEDVTIEGKPFWAVSGEIRKDALKGAGAQNPMMSMMKRARVLFSKEHDVFTGMEMLNAGGQKIMTMMMKNMNLEPKFADDTFVYTPPAGAKVTNMADLLRGMGAGGDEDEEDEDEAPVKPASKPAGGK